MVFQKDSPQKTQACCHSAILICIVTLFISCCLIEFTDWNSAFLGYLFYASVTAMAFFAGRLFFQNSDHKYLECSLINLLFVYFLLYFFRFAAEMTIDHTFLGETYFGSYLIVLAAGIFLLSIIRKHIYAALILSLLLAAAMKSIPFFAANLYPKEIVWILPMLIGGYLFEKFRDRNWFGKLIPIAAIAAAAAGIALHIAAGISGRFGTLNNMNKLLKNAFFGRVILVQSYLCGAVFVFILLLLFRRFEGWGKTSRIFCRTYLPEQLFSGMLLWNENWETYEKKKRIRSYLGIYSLAFVIITFGVFIAFLRKNRSLIWYPDGISGYYGNLMYLSTKGKYYLDNLASAGKLAYSNFDFSISLGRDVAQRFISSIVNPLQVIALFCPTDKVEYLYIFGIIARYFLTGISFSLYAFRFSKKPISVMTAAFLYTYCGFAVFAGVRHPHFLGMMCVFPILLLSIDDVIEKKSIIKLILSVFFGAMFAIYTFYIMSVVAVIYAFIRFFCVYRDNRLKEFIIAFSKCVFGYFMGLFMSAVTWLPSILVYQASGRIGKTDTIPLKSLINYDWSYYWSLINYYVVGKMTIGSWTCLGFTVISIPAIVHVFRMKKEKHLWARRLLVIFSLLLCMPVFAFVSSGFSSLYNRWCFAYALAVAVIVMYHLDSLPQADRKTIHCLVIGLIIFVGAVYINNRHHLTERMLWTFFLLAVCLLCLYGIHFRYKDIYWKGAYIIVAIASIVINANDVYSEHADNYQKEFSTVGLGEFNFTRTALADLKEYLDAHPDDDFYRVGSDDTGLATDNSTSYFGLYGMSDFNSAERLYNDFLIDTENSGIYDSTIRLGMDSRTLPMELSSVKYFAIKEKNASRIPYGYRVLTKITDEKDSGDGYYLLKNQKALSLGYVYRNYFTRDEYEAMGPLEKQEAMMQSALLEHETDFVESSEPSSTIQKLKVKKIVRNGVSYKKGKLKVNRGGSLEFKLGDVPDNCEIYVRLVGLNAAEGNNAARWTVIARVGQMQASSEMTSNTNVYSTQTDGRIINLGYYKKGLDKFRLYFSAGEYELSKIEVWAQPMQPYDEYVEKLKTDELDSLQMSGNEITAHFTATENEILCLTIPYSSVAGWTLWVDGQKADLFQVNTLYMGTEVEKGEHDIRLVYLSPKIRLCAGISVAGWLCFLVLAFILRKLKKNRGESGFKKRETAAEV